MPCRVWPAWREPWGRHPGGAATGSRGGGARGYRHHPVTRRAGTSRVPPERRPCPARGEVGGATGRGAGDVARRGRPVRPVGRKPDYRAIRRRTDRYDLTRREREVAVLVARGLTTREISTRLGISERTAGNHVARILRKLDLRSRAQVAVRRPGDRTPNLRTGLGFPRHSHRRFIGACFGPVSKMGVSEARKHDVSSCRL